eukprot:jgi/Botrbrau1/13485/Bobra.0082s0081.1
MPMLLEGAGCLGGPCRALHVSGGMWPLSAGITPFVTASTLSLPLLVSASHGNPPLSLARSAVSQTSASTCGTRVATSTSPSLARHRSPPPICSTSCLVGPPGALPKTSRPAMPMLCLWPLHSEAFSCETFGGRQ